MIQTDFLNQKYDKFYMRLAYEASLQTTSLKRQVGCLLVLPSGVLSIGYNGMPTGMDNACEVMDKTGRYLITKPEVVHAESDALNKLHRQGLSTMGATAYITTAPCLRCALNLAAVGVSRVVCMDPYKNMDGVEHLKQQLVKVDWIKNEYE